MDRQQKPKKGRITSRTTTYSHGAESYEISVIDDCVGFKIFYEGVKLREFSWKMDFAVEVALIILKGMNRQSLIETLISLQDFHPGDFSAPGEASRIVESDYSEMGRKILAAYGADPSDGIPLESISASSPSQYAYGEGFRIAVSSPMFDSFEDWRANSGISSVPSQFKAGFNDGLETRRNVDAIKAKGEESPQSDPVKIRAILDVLCDLSEVPVEEIQENIENGIAHLFSIGAITLDSAAEVAQWECKTQVNPKPTFQEGRGVGGAVLGDGRRLGVCEPSGEGFKEETLHVPSPAKETAPHPAGKTDKVHIELPATEQVILWLKRTDHSGLFQVLSALEAGSLVSPELIEFRKLWRGACEEKKPSAD